MLGADGYDAVAADRDGITVGGVGGAGKDLGAGDDEVSVLGYALISPSRKVEGL